MAELIGMPVQETEEFLCVMVSDRLVRCAVVKLLLRKLCLAFRKEGHLSAMKWCPFRVSIIKIVKKLSKSLGKK